MRLMMICLLLLGVVSPAWGADLRLAVLEFGNTSPAKDVDPLGKGLQSMLTTDLSQVPQLRLVERERLKDLRAEMRLSKGGLVDPATAVKMGKLLGATHLCSGSFTVVGERMRLDARLVVIATGEVLLAEQIEGDKSAFFELEKGLAQKIVAGIGIKLQPKERAVLAKIHTADFDAFQRYSQGVAAFDDLRYKDAIQAMQEASRLDKDFQLAAVTLAEYERLVAGLRTQADATEAEKEVQRMARAQQRAQEHHAKWADQIQQLWQIAARSGGGQAQRDRIAALYLLAGGYASHFQLQWHGGDHFALSRTRDDLVKRYYAEAAPLYPKIPPIYYPHAWESPRTGQDVPAWVAAQWARLEEQMGPPHRRRSVAEYLESQIGNYDEAARMLQLSAAETLRFRETLSRWAAQLDPGRPPVMGRESFAELYRDQLELDRSTQVLAALGKTAKDERALRAVASQIEINQKITELLVKGKAPALLREYLLLTPYQNGHEVAKMLAQGPSDEAMRYVQDARRLSRGRDYVYLGGAPVWLVHAGHEGDLSTGPRTDRLKADEVRYCPSAAERRDNAGYDNTPEALLIVEGRPRAAGRFKLQVRYTPAGDFRGPDRNGQVGPGRPEVGFAFGVRDVEHGGDDAAPQLHGYAVTLSEGRARLIAFQRQRSKDPRKVNGRRTELVTTKILEERPVGGRGERVPLEVRLGETIEVQVGGERVRFAAPAEREGFCGLMLRGMGYAAIGDIKTGD